MYQGAKTTSGAMERLRDMNSHTRQHHKHDKLCQKAGDVCHGNTEIVASTL